MNPDTNFCILNVKYEIIERLDASEGGVKTTEIEHIFVARKKSALLKKIQNFEDRLRNRQKSQLRSSVNSVRNYFLTYLMKYRHSYNTLFRL